MNNENINSSGLIAMITAASVVVVVAGLKAAEPILVPFLFGVFLAIIGTVPLGLLQRLKLPKSISILVVISIFIGAFYGIILLLASSVDGFIGRIPDYSIKIRELVDQINLYLINYGHGQISDLLLPLIQPEALFDLFGHTLKGFLNAISSTLVVFLFLAFMLSEAAQFKSKLLSAFGSGAELENMQSITSDVQRYLGIKTATSILTGVCIAGWAAIMDVDFPLLWGFVGMILNFIPIIGSIIASVPPILLALVMIGPQSALFLLLGYVVINVTIGHLIEPIFLGSKLGISVLIVFISLVFWGWLWGPAGALMAVPLTMIVKIFLEHNDDMRWLSVFMGANASKSKE